MTFLLARSCFRKATTLNVVLNKENSHRWRKYSFRENYEQCWLKGNIQSPIVYKIKELTKDSFVRERGNWMEPMVPTSEKQSR